MNKKLSEVPGMRIPHHSESDLKKLLSKDVLWEFLTNVYPDAIKPIDGHTKNHENTTKKGDS